MRSKFPIFESNPDLVYLDSAATCHKPKSVIDALTHFYSHEYATVHRAVYRSSLIATEKYNLARTTAQKFINAAHFEEVIFTRGTTDAINLVAQSYGRTFLKKGDEILISEMEHHSNIIPWQILAKETGAKLCLIPMSPEGILQWEGAITPKTKIVAVAHISNVTGTINPVALIAKEAHRMGAILLVDGAQASAHMKIDVQEIGCDFYAFSGHKCYGPTGIGVLYGKKELLAKMPPIQGGGDMADRVDMESSTYKEAPLRFEAGTPLIGPAIALKSALDFIEKTGRENIRAHEEKLLRLATVEMLKIKGLRILGTAPNKGPLITFVIDGIHPLDVASFLDVKHIAIRSGHLCAQPVLRCFGLEAADRISFGIYNTEEEVHQFIKALRECAELHKK
jgi:cysteine desulfurase/selenocysteine lyase